MNGGINTGHSDAWLATVIGASTGGFTVTPLITEVDGTPHPNLLVGAAEGITPQANDTVLVLTMRNNLDGKSISRFFKPSDATGVIVGVFKAVSGFTLTGNFTFVGDLTVTGALNVTGRATVGNLTVAGKAYELHEHLAGTLISAAPGNPVTGITGTLAP